MQFLILSRKTVLQVSPQVPHIVISIREQGQEFVQLPDNLSRVDVLRQTFIDADSEDIVCEGRFFDHELANEILSFVYRHKRHVDLIVCQCDGGVSRSAGVAAALLVILNGRGSDEWVFRSELYHPNRLVYREILHKHFGAMFSGEQK